MREEKDKKEQLQKTKEILDKIDKGIDILVPVGIIIAFVVAIISQYFV